MNNDLTVQEDIKQIKGIKRHLLFDQRNTVPPIWASAIRSLDRAISALCEQVPRVLTLEEALKSNKLVCIEHKFSGLHLPPVLIDTPTEDKETENIKDVLAFDRENYFVTWDMRYIRFWSYANEIYPTAEQMAATSWKDK